MTRSLTLDTVSGVLTRHIPLYRRMAPTYQTVMLQGLDQLWDARHRRVLDVGGGTGVIAQAIKELFGVEVTSVDVEDRFLETLDIETHTYDGVTLPFAAASFDAVILNNVIHHVPVAIRPALMRECGRVGGDGPIYVKDHVTASPIDRMRLMFLDLVGNAPFSGMIRASYLSDGDWNVLAQLAGLRIDASVGGEYRSGAFAALFPNRLERTMRWLPATQRMAPPKS
jgi:ubiquinone/menaquinone biosynthesis C-methylase UbiE